MIQLSPETAIDMLKHFPKRPDYNLWITTISALGNEFEIDTALDIIYSHWIDEIPLETENKLRYRLKKVNIGTFIYYAKQFGYNYHKTNTNKRHVVLKQKAISNYFEVLKPLNEPKKDVKLENVTKPKLYDLVGTTLEKKERTYFVCVNKSVLDKNLNPKTLKAYCNFDKLRNAFIPSLLNVNQLTNNIGSGFSTVFCSLKPENNRRYIRKSENFLYSNIFSIDIDNGLTLESAMNITETKKAILIYTTVNHKESNHRFRIIFPLKETITNKNDYSELIEYFVKLYGADSNCKDVTRAFYGNRNAKIFNLQNGEILQFSNGNQINENC